MGENDFRIDTPLYGLEIYKVPLTEKEFFAICKRLSYYAKKDGSSWFAVHSTTDHKTAAQSTIKTGRAGRPRKIVKGEKVAPHMHIGVVGIHGHRTAQSVKKAVNKKFEGSFSRVTHKNNLHAYNYVAYAFRQSDFYRSGGDFDFLEYLKHQPHDDNYFP